MGVARSSFYVDPGSRPEDAAVLAQIRAITDEFEAYGYRWIGAEFRHRGFVVNAKKLPPDERELPEPAATAARRQPDRFSMKRRSLKHKSLIVLADLGRFKISQTCCPSAPRQEIYSHALPNIESIRSGEFTACIIYGYFP